MKKRTRYTIESELEDFKDYNTILVESRIIEFVTRLDKNED